MSVNERTICPLCFRPRATVIQMSVAMRERSKGFSAYCYTPYVSCTAPSREAVGRALIAVWRPGASCRTLRDFIARHEKEKT